MRSFVTTTERKCVEHDRGEQRRVIENGDGNDTLTGGTGDDQVFGDGGLSGLRNNSLLTL